MDGKIDEMRVDFDGQLGVDELGPGAVTLRFAPGEPGNAGFTEYCRLSDDFRVIAIHGVLYGPAMDKLCGEDWIKFHFRVTGHGAFLFGSDSLVDLNAPLCTIRLQPRGLDEGHWYGDEEERQWVTIYCRRNILIDELRLSPKDFPGSLRRFLEGGAAEPFFTALTLTPQMRRIVVDITTSPCTGALRHTLLRAMAVELICLTVHAMGRTSGQAAGESGLKPSDVKRLYEARDILEADLANPPSVPELAAEVGINRTKLRAGFKQLFGTTIFEFCKEQRLDKAWTLLEIDGMSIGQVAEATGYEYDANFSTAFKKHFGILPKDVRKASKVSPAKKSVRSA